MDGLVEPGAIDGWGGRSMRLFCTVASRELVVFTPPHRRAFALEPYTCATDAANLGDKGGWRVLAPGATERLVVELWV
jgi:galactose mutarotase-like enzyme